MQLADAVRAALSRAVAAGDLVSAVPDEVLLDRPRSRDHGDYATPVALQLAGTAGLPPRRIAEVLVGQLGGVPGIASVDIAGPGFLNIRLAPATAGAVAGDVVAAGADYGSSKVLAGERINLELESTEPTGAVHLGVARRAAVADALGRLLITQGASVLRTAGVEQLAGEPMRVGKPAGAVICLDDLVEALGVDAARYWLIRYPAGTTPKPDLTVWTSQSRDNPVFHVQFAHARSSALATSAGQLGIDLGDTYDAALLDTPREADLIASIAAYPKVLATAAALREPYRVVRYLEGLASACHRFLDTVRVLPTGDEPATPVDVARVWLCAAARQTLANGLAVLGVLAPERM